MLSYSFGCILIWRYLESKSERYLFPSLPFILLSKADVFYVVQFPLCILVHAGHDRMQSDGNKSNLQIEII